MYCRICAALNGLSTEKSIINSGDLDLDNDFSKNSSFNEAVLETEETISDEDLEDLEEEDLDLEEDLEEADLEDLEDLEEADEDLEEGLEEDLEDEDLEEDLEDDLEEESPPLNEAPCSSKEIANEWMF
jgi:hypothetical protein